MLDSGVRGAAIIPPQRFPISFRRFGNSRNVEASVRFLKSGLLIPFLESDYSRLTRLFITITSFILPDARLDPCS
jgi:hypothetical protein